MAPLGPRQLTFLLDEHGAALVLYARQWCVSAEDVVQEALLQLMRQTSQTPPDNIVGWLYKVVRNGAISASRGERRRARRETAVAHRSEPCFNPSPGDRMDSEAAAKALKRLPIEQRETIVARIWGGLSLKQIAELTDSSTSTVHRRYQTGLEALREHLDGPCPKTPNTITGETNASEK